MIKYGGIHGRKPQPSTCRDPLVKKFFDLVDEHPTLTRYDVFIKAGYEPTLATKYARDALQMRVNMFRDLTEVVGLKLVLMDIE